MAKDCLGRELGVGDHVVHPIKGIGRVLTLGFAVISRLPDPETGEAARAVVLTPSGRSTERYTEDVVRVDPEQVPEGPREDLRRVLAGRRGP